MGVALRSAGKESCRLSRHDHGILRDKDSAKLTARSKQKTQLHRQKEGAKINLDKRRNRMSGSCDVTFL
jgi:hypothetical protein